ncbi:MAG: EamA family transporter [Rhizobiales bacterium 24-66-13]|jgi:drug/metabolite transporter (DMT)-like permease|nr:MAG: EamA family transporter [Rhizobiales bacterium 24-66-13]OZB04836.1 MAG: EamA family transporter [Rhizobiales bacterium 39-66-18]HQS10482.1 DMT family transporter [Xanthobacteraceae bacterium]HQS48888.1 DMT family transporter [Xanthobacteraceae bacterium]
MTIAGHKMQLSGRRDSTLAGIGLMCLAVVCFALCDATAKWLSGHINVFMVVWARYVVQLVLALVLFNPWTVPGLMRTRRPWLQLFRSALLFACTALNFCALQYLQLDQTVSIMFSTPFFVALFAGPMLGEWIGVRRWAAILVGFAGIILVARPGVGGIHPAALLMLAAAVCYSLYGITTRMLAATDASQTTLVYSSLVGALAASVPLFWMWETPREPLVLGAMLELGAVVGAGHFLLILAHARAPAATLSPFIYTQIISMIILGWLLFGNLPNAWTLTGAAVVVSSGIYLLLQERRDRARKTLYATTPD